MTMRSIFRSTLVLFAVALLFGTASAASAQDVVPAPEPRPSPMAVAQATLSDGTYISIRYSSPRKRGREVFGGLVPMGQVWRLGANEATEITVTQDVMLGGERIPAGTYALFAIPGDGEWTLIVNETLGQWGAYSYSQDSDLTRVVAAVETTDSSHEAFMISLEPNEDESAATISMVWDRTRVTVPIHSIN